MFHLMILDVYLFLKLGYIIIKLILHIYSLFVKIIIKKIKYIICDSKKVLNIIIQKYIKRTKHCHNGWGLIKLVHSIK